MNDDEIRSRLQALGEEPIDEQTRAAHMRRMAAGVVADEPRRRGFVWAGIAAAAVVGFLAGSTGLAMADALPDQAQDVAHDVLRVVQVDVPQGKEGKRGPCIAEAAKIKDKDEKKAAKDACPKGGDDENGDETDETGDETGTPGQGPPPADDPCRGRPPWAGPMSKEQREAAKASASRANCPQDDQDERGEGGEAGPPPADDPCRGRPPWAGPMSKEQREAAKASASRANCPQDDDDEGADADASADAADASTTTTESTTTSTTSSPSTTSTTSTTVPDESTESAESTAIDEPPSGD